MTRESRIAKARKLREQGLTYREIGERLGVSTSVAYNDITGKQEEAKRRWVQEHPERVRAQNLARHAAKREWEAGTCQQCGGPQATGKRSECCDQCHRANRRAASVERAKGFIELRERGFLNYEIAEHEGASEPAVASLLSRASRVYGLTVPPSPYHSGAAV